MANKTNRNLAPQKGYALLSTLILLFLLTAIAIGMLYSSLSERTNATSDMQKNRAFYGAEAAMEKMTADLGTLYGNEKAPTLNDINGLKQPTAENIARWIFERITGELCQCIPDERLGMIEPPRVVSVKVIESEGSEACYTP